MDPPKMSAEQMRIVEKNIFAKLELIFKNYLTFKPIFKVLSIPMFYGFQEIFHYGQTMAYLQKIYISHIIYEFIKERKYQGRKL